MIGSLKPAMPQIGSFLKVRGKSWIVEGAERRGLVDVVTLISCEDDSQGEAIELAYFAELQPEILDPNDWSPLLTRTFEGPQRLGAYLRSTEWRTATAADRKLFQAPFRAGIRLESYQLLPLAKALELPRVNLLIGDDVGLGKTVEAGLIVRELLLRRRVDTVVVAAPASMLLQWQDELAQKFGLDFTIVDREHLLATRRSRGFSANPWSVGSRFIVSHSVLSDETYTGACHAAAAGLRSVVEWRGAGRHPGAGAGDAASVARSRRPQPVRRRRMGGDAASAAGAAAAQNECQCGHPGHTQRAAADLCTTSRIRGLAHLAAGGARPRRRPADAGWPEALPRPQRLLHRRAGAAAAQAPGSLARGAERRLRKALRPGPRRAL
ncbi:SNF2-related protein [Bradyrhizobium sp. SZCCHNS2005]|uniref:SNF2-related protein n=1 Tax=Bradyrhizobium sp. SZCCHNS2005 TaxID=3057303 RepID=UPI0028EBCE0E|nr:SNF2-related protein [Bradyrhizobium sp. SZCCHNS2005]